MEGEMRRHNLVPLTLACVASFLALTGFAASWSAGEDPAIRLERAIQLETVDGDLAAAIAQYEQIIEGDGNTRALVARALLRLGGCYEKLGHREARKVYQRLVDDYADQAQEVSLARQRLAALPRDAPAAASAPTFRRIQIPGKPPRRSGAMLSPDGTRFAFVAEGGIWTVPLSGRVRPDIAGEPTRLTPDMGAWDNGNMSFGWSFDGRWIAFRGRPDDSVYLVPSAGGEPKKVEGSGPSGQGVRPSVSPVGETVAVTRWHEKRSHIFAFPLAGGEPKLVTEEPGMYPAFSPDGKLIAYVPSSYSADRGLSPPKTTQVKVVAVQGGATTVVHESEGRPSAPTWSPDGTMIAFGHWSETGETEKSEIYIVPVSSEGRPRGEPTRISLEGLVSTTLNGEPARKLVNHLGGWSRRDEIALLLDTPFDEGIYTVPAAGGRATRVALAGREPRWSPDGSRIFFRGDSMAALIASVPARGGVEKPVPIQGEYPPAVLVVAFPSGSNDVSPDGKSIVFAGFYRDSREAPGGSIIFTVPSEGGEARALTDPKEGNASNPCWSPDGRWIAYTRQRSLGSAEGMEVLLVPSAGGATKRLTSGEDQVAGAEIAWSPDGRTIAFFGKDGTVRSIPAVGGTSRVLGEAGRSLIQHLGLSWSPDGTRLAYTDFEQVLVIPASGGEPEVVRPGFEGAITQLDWSPDGQTFAFMGVTGGEEEIWLMSDFLPLVRAAQR
jgi:Tol biopolymer transport system component